MRIRRVAAAIALVAGSLAPGIAFAQAAVAAEHRGRELEHGYKLEHVEALGKPLEPDEPTNPRTYELYEPTNSTNPTNRHITRRAARSSAECARRDELGDNRPLAKQRRAGRTLRRRSLDRSA